MTQEEQMESLKPIIKEFDEAPKGQVIPSDWKAPEGYVLKKFTVKGVPVEQLIPEKTNGKVILQMHGGGYLVALMDNYRWGAVQYSKMSGGAEVFSLDYRVAPTYEAPAALEDAVAVYSYLLEQGYKSKDILFVGDSAGGNLVLVTTLYLRDHNIPLPIGVVAVSPWGVADDSPASREKNRLKDLFIGEKGTRLWHEAFKSTYFQHADVKDPYISPVYADFTGFPSLLIQAGEYEVLGDDSLMIAKAAKEAGVDVTYTAYEGVSHDFQLTIPQMEASKKALAQMQEFMKKCFTK